MAIDRHRFYAPRVPWEDRGPDVTVPAERVAVRVRARFQDGFVGEALGYAVAWTPRAVECRFMHPDPAAEGDLYRVWVPVEDVTRHLEDDDDDDDDLAAGER